MAEQEAVELKLNTLRCGFEASNRKMKMTGKGHVIYGVCLID